MRRTILLGSTAVLFSGLAWAMPATAQANETAQNKPADTLGDIVVTAQRRAENLQDVPIAATALNGDQLNDKAVKRLSDLQFAAPSLSVTDQGLTQSVNIRGIGIASGSPSVANGVAVYIDGIFQPPILTTSSFYDIGNVEVLRGPQGTLVGSNSTGGAMFINTQAPLLGGVHGYAQSSYGTYDEFTAQGALNIPVTSTLAIRGAGNFRSRDSYYDDLGPLDNHPDRLNEKAGRLGILWAPGDFRATARVEWIDKNSGGYAYRPIPGTPFAAGRTSDIRDLNYNSPTLNHERGFLSSLELRYQFAGGIVLRSVSGYTNKRINNLYDTDATTLAFQTQNQFVRERQWSQEISLISPTTGAFNWILGGYYQRNKIDVNIQNISGPPAPDPTDVLIFTDKTTFGIFAQTGYKLTKAIEVQLGLRYSGSRNKGDGSVKIGNGLPFFPPGGLQVASLAGSHDDNRLTGKAAINWKLDNDNLAYAFAARGYKPGGFNSATSQFGPETVWDYEVGLKSSFAGHHLRTQIGAFYMNYSNFQFDAINPASGQNGVLNVADATIKGFEAQIQGRFGGLGLDGGVAFVDSSLGSLSMVNPRLLPPGTNLPQCAPGQLPGAPPTCFNYQPFIGTAGGGPNLFSPKWTYNLGADYKFSLGGKTTLTPRVNYAFIGPRFTNLFYSRVTDYLAGRGLLSAQLTLSIDRWSIEAYGTNLANTAYVSGQSGNNEFYGAPREYGVRVSTRF